MENNTWSALIERAKTNDQDAFYALYQNSYDAVYRTVKSMVRDEDASLDIVQDAFVKGFSSLDALDNPDSFLPWLKRIAANKAKDWFKKRQDITFSQMADEEGNDPDFEDERTENLPEAVLDRQETARLIKEILDTLSDEQRIVIGMFYYENMSVAQIARDLEISENTVKSRLNYGRKKIKAGVEELEAKGTKLYGLAPVAFLLWLFRTQIASVAAGGAPAASFGPIMSQVAAQSAAAAAASAGSELLSSAGSAASAGSASTVAAADAAGKTVGFLSTLGGKLVAGIVAFGMVGGGIWAGLSLASRHEEDPPASTPITEATEEVREETIEEERNFIVLSQGYEEIVNHPVAETADHRVVLAKSGGLWGAINERGETVIPFEYDSMEAPVAFGYIDAKKGDTYFIFDSAGQELLRSERSLYSGNGVAVSAEKYYEYEGEDENDPDYEHLYYRVQILSLPSGEVLFRHDRAVTYNVAIYDPYILVVDADGSLTIYGSKGEIVRQDRAEYPEESAFRAPWGGYYRQVVRFSTGTLFFDVNGTQRHDIANDDDFRYYVYNNVGTLVQIGQSSYTHQQTKTKYYLLDMANHMERFGYDIDPADFLTQKGYDDISLNSREEYFLVRDGERRGFLSRDGQTEKLYDDAGDFVRGKAIVLDGDTAYVIDEKLERISDELSGYTAVKTLGEGLFGVEKDGVWYLAVFKE